MRSESTAGIPEAATRTETQPSTVAPAPRRTFSARLRRWRVPLGFLLVVGGMFFVRPTAQSLMIGGPIALSGALLRAWAAGHLRKNASLATSGPYAFTRNPLYLGSALLGVGGITAAGAWWAGLLMLAMYCVVYIPTMRAEASHIRALFPDTFDAYAAGVPLFVPRLTPWAGRERRGFSGRTYVKNREYNAGLGTLGFFAYLVGALVVQNGMLDREMPERLPEQVSAMP